jgi:hypothetical protein
MPCARAKSKGLRVGQKGRLNREAVNMKLPNGHLLSRVHVRVRRMLERPFGSVRWKEDTPDRAASEVLPVATAAGSST